LPAFALKNSAFTFRQIQSRKVHENLVSAQLARQHFASFFSKRSARHATRAANAQRCIDKSGARAVILSAPSRHAR
jgi:hypothetical protein